MEGGDAVMDKMTEMDAVLNVMGNGKDDDDLNEIRNEDV